MASSDEACCLGVLGEDLGFREDGLRLESEKPGVWSEVSARAW